MYQKTLVAVWGDMDYNAHMRNTAYLDKAADVRMMYFADAGFPMPEFARLQLGPVVRKDVVEYFREIDLLDEIIVTIERAGLSADASRMLLRNEFDRKGTLAARVASTAGWYDLASRKLVCPPDNLAQPLRDMSRSADFSAMAGSHTHMNSDASTCIPRAVKKRLIPIGDTSITCHGANTRAADHGHHSATSSPPLVNMSSSGCDSVARPAKANALVRVVCKARANISAIKPINNANASE